MGIVVLMFIGVVGMLGLANAAVYKVGDSTGWTTIGNYDYKQWAATKSFQVGDTIIFKYLPQFHNVMRVNHAMYKACNVTTPIATFTTGNDSMKITKHGHHYFLCGVPGHCQGGQKVDINVLRLSSIAPTPSASSSGSTASSLLAPSANVPAPLPNTAASLNGLRGVLGGVVVVFATFVFGFA